MLTHAEAADTAGPLAGVARHIMQGALYRVCKGLRAWVGSKGENVSMHARIHTCVHKGHYIPPSLEPIWGDGRLPPWPLMRGEFDGIMLILPLLLFMLLRSLGSACRGVCQCGGERPTSHAAVSAGLRRACGVRSAFKA